ncbi:MAG TPA: hypothetical protein VLE93_02965 [Candidatus Saccharimonadales bacterium]|nr:hypothetical protein [Candidatus Saccharimonadales bacterium]
MPPKPLHLTVAGFENGCAILKSGETTLKVPRGDLPDTAKIGDVLAADFYFAVDAKKRKENLAKALLEEILGKE